MNMESGPTGPDKNQKLESEWEEIQGEWHRAFMALKSDESYGTAFNVTIDLEQENLEEFLKDNFQYLTPNQVNFLLASLRSKKFKSDNSSFEASYAHKIREGNG